MSALAKHDDYDLTAHEQVNLFEIAHQMNKARLPEAFIVSAINAAAKFEGIADLVNMWATETNTNEQNEIIADIQDLIEDSTKHDKQAFNIKLNDLETISQHTREFKDSLLKAVVEYGGIKRLSEVTGIPQPSLSRFFNSGSIPQRSTLLKISSALELDTVKIESQWNPKFPLF